MLDWETRKGRSQGGLVSKKKKSEKDSEKAKRKKKLSSTQWVFV